MTEGKKLRVYCETSFWSFLNGRPTPLVHIAVKQAAQEACAYEDPMDEIYAIRRQISEKCGHNIDRLFELLAGRQAKDEANGIRYVSLPIARRRSVME